MTDDQWTPTKIAQAIARDLTAIGQMYLDLAGEAINRAGDPDIPGGEAMVMLGPGADLEAWGYVELSAIFGRLKLDNIEVERIVRRDTEPPLSFLASWADIVREARGGLPTPRLASIEGEISFLRASIDWMTNTQEDGTLWWMPVEDFAEGLHRVRRALESVLHDGFRPDRLRAKCNQCAERARLIRVFGKAEDGSQDHFACPDCHHAGDAAWVARCWHAMVADREGEQPEWVTVQVAAAGVGRSPKTIRRWTEARADGTRKVDVRTGDSGLREVSWADVRAADDTSERRRRARAAA